jgi:molybdopterin/thiamine biosynthesis adenylyltransferase
MVGKYVHEERYRGAAAVAKLAKVRLVLCGAGALGSHLADNLARQGFTSIRVIDHDRVEQHNVGTQLYGDSDVGVWKVEALRNRLFRGCGVEVDGVRKELVAANARTLLKDVDLVLDTFDNSASRRLVQETCRAEGLTCLHAGMFEDYCEVIWDEQYRVPNDAPAGVDVCEYPLARNLVMLTVTIASEAVMSFAIDGKRPSWSATLRDFAVRAVS